MSSEKYIQVIEDINKELMTSELSEHAGTFESAYVFSCFYSIVHLKNHRKQ